MIDKIFVKPGDGRKVPLPIPGGGKVPAEGAEVVLNGAVRRLLTTGDLVEAPMPEAEPVTKAVTRNVATVEAEATAKPALVPGFSTTAKEK